MVNRREHTKLVILEELDKYMEKSIDRKYDLYKYYKIGDPENPEEMWFKTQQMEALCSGYCQVEEFTKKVLIQGEEEEDKTEKDQNTYWEDHVRYRKCILTRAFNSETNKCKELYEWVYRPNPHSM